MATNLTEKDWQLLLQRIRDGKCTPLLGAGACHGSLPLGSDLAKGWAEEFCYPLDDVHNLMRVAQFLAIDRDAVFPKDRIVAQFAQAKAPDFLQVDEPHSVLASLPLPIYLTTNYDPFMFEALRLSQRSPRRQICAWNKILRSRAPSVPSIDGYEPDVANPLVFHLHGDTSVSESLVVTEDDYLDFLRSVVENPALLPPRIQEAFSSISLLFLGYSITDWNFRVLFNILVRYLEISSRRTHISVQILPDVQEMRRDRVRDYLDRYFQELKIRVYWGTCREFSAELRQRWEDFSNDR